MGFLKEFTILIARICISSLFLWAGVAKIIEWKGTIEYMRSRHVQHTTLFLVLAVMLQIFGGLSILVGYHTHIGAILLIIFTIPAAVKMHAFWNFRDEDKRIIELSLFMKDVAILGALLLLIILGAGHFSFDRS